MCKKTCYNCRHLHGCVSETTRNFHIHDFCEKWGCSLTGSAVMQSPVNHFLHTISWDIIDTVTAEASFTPAICSDLETGEAVCWKFTPAAPTEIIDEEWFDKNRENNKRLALLTISYMLDNAIYSDLERAELLKLKAEIQEKE